MIELSTILVSILVAVLIVLGLAGLMVLFVYLALTHFTIG